MLFIALIAALLTAGLAAPFDSAYASTVELWDFIWPHSPRVSSWLEDEVFPAFQRETGITVVRCLSTTTETRLAIASGEGPDLLFVANDLGRFLQPGGLEPLTPLLLRENLRGVFPPAFLRPDPTTGEIYALPIGLYLRGVMYNERSFRDAGVAPLGSPAAWQDLIEAAAKLTRIEGNVQERLGFDDADGWRSLLFYTFLYQNGGTPWSEDGRRITVDAKPAVETARFLRTLAAMGYPGDLAGRVGTKRSADVVREFAAGRTAMVTASQVWLAEIGRSLPDLLSAIGFLPTRGPSAGSYSVLTGVHGIAMSRMARNSEGARRFVSWFLRKEILAALSRVAGSLIPRTDAEDLVLAYQPHLLDWYAALKYSAPFPAVPRPPNPRLDFGLLNGILLDIFRGNTDPQEDLTLLADVWQDQLDRAWDRVQER